MNHDDVDYPEWIKHRTQKAAKQYTCSLCNGPIVHGELHTYSVYKLDGKFHVDRCHYPQGLCCYGEQL